MARKITQTSGLFAVMNWLVINATRPIQRTLPPHSHWRAILLEECIQIFTIHSNSLPKWNFNKATGKYLQLTLIWTSNLSHPPFSWNSFSSKWGARSDPNVTVVAINKSYCTSVNVCTSRAYPGRKEEFCKATTVTVGCVNRYRTSYPQKKTFCNWYLLQIIIKKSPSLKLYYFN